MLTSSASLLGNGTHCSRTCAFSTFIDTSTVYKMSMSIATSRNKATLSDVTSLPSQSSPEQRSLRFRVQGLEGLEVRVWGSEFGYRV